MEPLGGHDLQTMAAASARRFAGAGLMLAVAVAPWTGAAAVPPKPPQTLEQLDQACSSARQRGNVSELRLLQRQLLLVRPAPQPLPVVLANADALLRCGAPDGALLVLNRFSPAPGPEQVQWTLLQWRAANAALDHRLAADALRRLASAAGRSLEQLQLPVSQEAPGRWRTMAALDLLASHLDAMGQRDQAALVLLASRTPGVETAQRLSQAVSWSSSLPLESRLRWLELALEQAAAAGSWGLAAELLDQQLALLEDQSPALRRRVEERRRRLSRSIDDAAQLKPQAVRSPRDPGGHAATPAQVPAPAASQP